MKLKDITEIKGTISLISGLHIGAGDMEMKIGGTDNPVIKHPHTLEPYIPGSSIKGKVRSLLEVKSGLMGKTGGRPLSLKNLQGLSGDQENDCRKILKLFGSSGADREETESIGPTRASFADCPLDGNWRESAKDRRLALTEVKSENSINRIKGTAENPRFTERVPADTVFAFSVSLKLFEEDEGEGLLETLLGGLKLLEMDALGGSGSRGYGRIKFYFEDQNISKKFNSLNLF